MICIINDLRLNMLKYEMIYGFIVIPNIYRE